MSCDKSVEVGRCEQFARADLAFTEGGVTDLAPADVDVERLDRTAEPCCRLGHGERPIGRGNPRLALPARLRLRRWRSRWLQGNCELIEPAVITAAQCALDLGNKIRRQVRHRHGDKLVREVELGGEEPGARQAIGGGAQAGGDVGHVHQRLGEVSTTEPL